MSSRSSANAANGTITIVLADDHHVVRTGLRLLLDAEDGFAVVGEAADAEAALRTVLGHKPSVLVLDLNMPGETTSLEAIPLVRERSAGTAVVVLTMQEDPSFARHALQAGAAGYVLKDSAHAELVEALRRAGLGLEGLRQCGARRGRPARGRRRDVPRPAPRRRARRVAGRGRRAARRPHAARARGASAHRPRPYERRDRRAAVPLDPHGRVAPRAHPAKAAALVARGARALRPRPRPARRLVRAGWPGGVIAAERGARGPAGRRGRCSSSGSPAPTVSRARGCRRRAGGRGPGGRTGRCASRRRRARRSGGG